MKLTRKHLNQILLQLPDPRLVLEGSIAPTIQVPIHKQMAVIHPNYDYPTTTKIRQLTFDFTHEDLDWVLRDLEL